MEGMGPHNRQRHGQKRLQLELAGAEPFVELAVLSSWHNEHMNDTNEARPETCHASNSGGVTFRKFCKRLGGQRSHHRVRLKELHAWGRPEQTIENVLFFYDVPRESKGGKGAHCHPNSNRWVVVHSSSCFCRWLGSNREGLAPEADV